MISYYGDFAEDDTVLIPFNTFSSNDPAASVTITNLADGDLKVHKDGSVTQIVTDGATITIDFDTITGNHLATIDTSAHADYSTGSEYAVRIEGTTVDGATINAWIGAFSIERAGGVLALLKGTNSLANIEDKIDIIDTNVDQIETAVITNAAGVDVAADIIALKAETVLIVADTNELQTDNVPGLISTLDAVVDTVKAETALIVADTNELQTDDVPGLIATLDAVVDTVKAETALIVADTDELQGDWVNGGRLDLLLDAIPTTAMRGTDNALLAANISLTGGALDVVTAVTDRVTANTDQIAGVAAAASQLSLSADTVIGLGTASGTPTTTTMVSDIGVTVDDQYNGRIIIFADNTTTAALRDQATDITACTASSNTLTFTALTTAPVSGDTFVIV